MTAEESIRYDQFYWFETLAQVINITILAGSILCIFLSVLGLTAKRSFAAIKVSAIFALIFGIAYLAEGYIFLWIVRFNFKEIFTFIEAEIDTNKLFFTYCYIPCLVFNLVSLNFAGGFEFSGSDIDNIKYAENGFDLLGGNSKITLLLKY